MDVTLGILCNIRLLCKIREPHVTLPKLLQLGLNACIFICVGKFPTVQRKVQVMSEFEIINETEVEAVRRGRPSNASPELIQALKGLKSGQALRLSGFACDPKSEDYGTQKSSKSATIRTAGDQAGVTVSIKWSPAGIPQVMVKPQKASAKK